MPKPRRAGTGETRNPASTVPSTRLNTPATRNSLISRLKRADDHESWQSFFNVYWRLIYGAAIDAGLTETEAEDVVQETVISVLKAIPQFEYDPNRGHFRNWLLQLTGWRIKDQFRNRGREELVPVVAGQLDVDKLPFPPEQDLGIPDLEQKWKDEWDTNLLSAAVERVRHRTDPKQFQLFELYVLNDWPIQKICSVLNVSAPRIYLTKHRIMSQIKKELAYLNTKCF